jgi:hypothetical protein
MGKLFYGQTIEIDADDQSLFHLDVIVAALKGATFQLHLLDGPEQGGSILSISVGAGASLALQYANSSELKLNSGVIGTAMQTIADANFISLPFTFDDSEAASI